MYRRNESGRKLRTESQYIGFWSMPVKVASRPAHLEQDVLIKYHTPLRRPMTSLKGAKTTFNNPIPAPPVPSPDDPGAPDRLERRGARSFVCRLDDPDSVRIFSGSSTRRTLSPGEADPEVGPGSGS